MFEFFFSYLKYHTSGNPVLSVNSELVRITRKNTCDYYKFVMLNRVGHPLAPS